MSDAFNNFLSHVSSVTQDIGQQLHGVNQLPTAREVIERLQHFEVYQAAILLVVGVVYLLWGAKIFKFLVTLNLALVGLVLGSALGATHNSAWSMYGALIGAAVLAILAWPLMKFAVSFMAASAGAFAGYNLWHYVTAIYRHDLTQYAYVGAIIGMVLLGALAFVLFRTVIMLFTSLQGAVLAVAGGVALALRYGPANKAVQDHLCNDPHLLPLLVIIPTAIGFFFQAWGMARAKSAPPPAAPAKAK